MGLLKNGESSAPIFDAPQCCSVGPDRVLVTSPELWYPEAESVTPDAHCVFHIGQICSPPGKGSSRDSIHLDV